MQDLGRRVFRATAIQSGSTFLVFALGFLKNILAAYYFGTSRDMDIYLLALVIPDATQLMATTGLFSFIPIYASERASKGEDAAWRSAGRMATYWLMLLGVALTGVYFLAPLLVGLVAPGYDQAHRLITLHHTRTLVLMAVSVGTARVLSAMLMARKRFLVANLGEVAFRVGSMLYLVAFHSWGIDSLVWGMVAGGLLQFAVTAGGLALERRGLPLSLDFKDPAVRKMVRLVLPVYVGNGGAQLNAAVIRAFASTLAAGVVSALQYAYFIVDNLAEIFGNGLAGALLPYLSEQFAEKQGSRFGRTLDRGLTAIAIIMVPASVGLTLLARPIVHLLFERGSFDSHSAAITVMALRVYAPALLAIGLNHLLGSVYYAQQDSTTPMRIGLLRVGFTALGCWLLVPRLGHVGVALAMAGGQYLKLGLMLLFLRRAEERAALHLALRSFARMAPAVGLMALAVHGVAAFVLPQAIGSSAVLAFAMQVVLGALVYAAGLYFLAAPDFAYFLGLLRRVLGREPAGGMA